MKYKEWFDMGFKRFQAAAFYHCGIKLRRNSVKTIIVAVLILSIILYWYVFATPASTPDSPVRAKGREMHKDITQKVERGLKASGSSFTLDGRSFTILSGAVHYFRLMPEYWEDRLLKLKAMGLNTVETYIPWNLHEETKGDFKFSEDLDVVKYVETARNLGLYVIMRPGPYICSEWDLGGLPSWLLNDPNQKLRTTYAPFIEAVDKYFGELLRLLAPLQYSKGGPIIGWQIENEYIMFGSDWSYMEKIQEIMLKRGVTELLFTSDPRVPTNEPLTMNKVLKTLNFQKNEISHLKDLKRLQPDKPLMVMEFWTGWYDNWGEDHNSLSAEKAATRVKNILEMGASINFYMFHGGTNFGFMNGANKLWHLPGNTYQPAVTSYDYDALLSEAGDITPKYEALREIIRKHAPKHSIPKEFPAITMSIKKIAYGSIEMNNFLALETIYKFVDQAYDSKEIVPMEFLKINNNGGQGYGFIVYQTALPHDAKKLTIEKYRDRVQVLINSKLITTLDTFNTSKKAFDVDKMEKSEVYLNFEKPADEDQKVVLDILVENMGRINVGIDMNSQRKGILGQVLIDGKRPRKWRLFPLDFNRVFTNEAFSKAGWASVPEGYSQHTPSFYKGTLMIRGQPQDTFVLMKGWGKGVCFVNDRNLGRYWKIGPQQTLYLPASWLRAGENTIVLFELEDRRKDGKLEFSSTPVLGTPVQRS